MKGKQPASKILTGSVSANSSVEYTDFEFKYPDLKELNSLPFDFCEVQSDAPIQVVVNGSMTFQLYTAGVMPIRGIINQIKLVNNNDYEINYIVTLVQTGE